MLSRDYYVVAVIIIFRNHSKSWELAGFIMAPTIRLLFSSDEGRRTVGAR